MNEPSETLPKAINGSGPRPAPYLQTARGARRDSHARDRWDALSEKERAQIRRHVTRLFEIKGLSDVSVAELLTALGSAGILALWGPSPDDDIEGPEPWSDGGGEDGQ